MIKPMYKYVSLCLCVLMLLCAVVGCSNQVLLPDGTIVTAGQTQPTDTKSPTGVTEDTKASLGGSLTLAPEVETKSPSISLGGSPDEMFKNAPHVMHAEFLNTGESDCILLRMDDKVVLVDTADTDDSLKIKNKLESRNITAIDYLILTHYDNDHIGSVSAILASFEVKEVYMPDYVRDSGLYRTMMSALEEKVPVEKIHRISEDVTFDVGYGSLWLNTTKLYETGITVGDDATSTIVENNFSIITSVTFGKIKMLLTGDAEEARMQEFNALFDEGEYPQYTLVKTPHHGGYDKAFKTCLYATTPRYCVVTTDTKDKVEAGLVTDMLDCCASAYYSYEGDVWFATDGSATTSYTIFQEK